MTFSDLGLNEAILRAISGAGYEVPTPIQAKAIPHVLAGKDVLGCAQTGTGKTAAFCLPMADRLMASGGPKTAAPIARGPGKAHPGHTPRARRAIRALILSPTRELTLQIAENLEIYARNTGLRHTVIFGGVGQGQQVRDLKAGVDIVVATPGRLEDLMQQGYVDLRHVEIFVLDEADRMLDMGFIQPIRRIAAAVPKQRQTLLFSATMPKEIRHLADALLSNPENVQVAPAASLPSLIEHSVYHVSRGDKPALLTHVLKTTDITRVLVFTRTKHGADKIVKRLGYDGLHAEAIHGNKRQNVRQRTLANFKSGRTPVLVATDIAARGIDVDEVTHVINYDLPNEPETYVHRIGRTGRAGMTGVAMSFCDHEERSYLKLIERLVNRPIEVTPTPRLERAAMAAAPGSDAAGYVEDRERPRRGGRMGYGDRGGKPHAHRNSQGGPPSGGRPHGRRPAAGHGGQSQGGQGNGGPSFGGGQGRRSGSPSQAGASAQRSGGGHSHQGKPNQPRGGPRQQPGSGFRGKARVNSGNRTR